MLRLHPQPDPDAYRALGIVTYAERAETPLQPWSGRKAAAKRDSSGFYISMQVASFLPEPGDLKGFGEAAIAVDAERAVSTARPKTFHINYNHRGYTLPEYQSIDVYDGE